MYKNFTSFKKKKTYHTEKRNPISAGVQLYYLDKDSKLYMIVANNYVKVYHPKYSKPSKDAKEDLEKQKLITTKYENFAGLVEEGEDIPLTRKRELFEETNGTLDLEYNLFEHDQNFIIVDGKEHKIQNLIDSYNTNTFIFQEIKKERRKNNLESIPGFNETNDLTYFEISKDLIDKFENGIEDKDYIKYLHVGKHKSTYQCYYKVQDYFEKEIWIRRDTLKHAISFCQSKRDVPILEIDKIKDSNEIISWKNKKTTEVFEQKVYALSKVQLVKKSSERN